MFDGVVRENKCSVAGKLAVCILTSDLREHRHSGKFLLSDDLTTRLK